MDTNINRQTMTNQVYKIIKKRIINGVYSPREKLTEQGIGKNLNVSATPVREAFNRLISEGYIESIPYRGVFIREYSYDEIRDAHLVRSVLEGLLVRLMIEKMSDKDLASLEEAFESSLKSNESDIRRRFYSFHVKMFNITKSKIVEESIKSISAIVSIDIQCSHPSKSDDVDIINENKELLEYIKKKDVENAVKQVEIIAIRNMKDALDNYSV